jgi:hypothetical protein
MTARLPRLVPILLIPLICCAADGGCNTSNERIGPSGGEVAGVAIAAVAVVAAVIIIPVEINKSHHTLKGCVLSTPSGLELRTADNQTYALSGTTADLTPGNTIRVHGDRQKHDKSAAGDQVFLVQKMQKNYGPCQALASTQTPRPAQP